MSFLDKVARIRAELLGADDDMPAAQVVATALPLMAAPKEAPAGFRLTTSPPSAQMLAFSKEASAADELVGRSILYNWPVVGWCIGTIQARNTDGRYSKTIDGQREKVNFIIYYEIDDDEVMTVLRTVDHGGVEEGAWVLLEPLEAAHPEA